MTSPPQKDKAQGANSKRTIDSIYAHIPKVVKEGLREKHCSLYKKHGGMHTTHNTKECNDCNKDRTHKKTVSTHIPDTLFCRKDGRNFSQVIHAKCKKAVYNALKKSNHGKKCHNCHEDSDSGPNSDYCNVGLDCTGDVYVLSKLKTSESFDDIVPCPMRAIPSKISHKPFDLLGVTALVVIIEPATENLSSKVPQIPLRSHPSNKMWVLQDMGSYGDFIFHEKGNPKIFLT